MILTGTATAYHRQVFHLVFPAFTPRSCTYPFAGLLNRDAHRSTCSLNSGQKPCHNQFAPRAFRSGALESIIRPVNGRLSSSMRKIAQAAEKANRDRQVKSVEFRGEKRL